MLTDEQLAGHFQPPRHRELRTERQAWDELMKRQPICHGQEDYTPFGAPDAGSQAASTYGYEDAETQIRGLEGYRWGAIVITLGWLTALGVMVYRVWGYWQ